MKPMKTTSSKAASRKNSRPAPHKNVQKWKLKKKTTAIYCESEFPAAPYPGPEPLPVLSTDDLIGLSPCPSTSTEMFEASETNTDNDNTTPSCASSSGRLGCDLCNFITKTQKGLIPHMKLHTTKESLLCWKCGKTFTEPRTLENHVKKIHNKIRARNVICPICSETFIDHQKLYAHSLVHFRNNVESFKCTEPNCNFATFRQHTLVKHAHLQHGGPKPTKPSTFMCGQCLYTAKKKDHLKVHMQIHSDEKPFACPHPHCNYHGKQKANLKRHIETQHPPLITAPTAESDTPQLNITGSSELP